MALAQREPDSCGETGAAGLEPATSGVTGGHGCVGPTGIRQDSRRPWFVTVKETAAAVAGTDSGTSSNLATTVA